MKLSQWIAVGLFTTLPFAAKSDNATITIPLEPGVAGQRGGGSQRLIFKDKNEASIPFATSSGKLLFKLNGKKITVDSNCDGKIDSADGAAIAAGGKTTVCIKTHGKKLDYEIRVRYIHQKMAAINGVTILKGKYNGKDISVFDSNVNGKFNDQGKHGSDIISLGDITKRDITKQLPISPIFNLDGEMHNLTFADGKAELVFTPYTGDIAELTLKSGKEGWFGQMMLTKQDGTFSAVADSTRKAQLVPGKYIVAGGVIYSKGSVGYEKSQGCLFGGGEEVTIKKGGNEFKMGAPFRLDFLAYKSKRDANQLKIKKVEIIDAGGMKYSAQLYKSQQKSTLKSYIKAGNKKKLLTTLAYG
ncbi:hypothetical protein ACFLS1_00200 [Verrucomicrobiota bacterium]